MASESVQASITAKLQHNFSPVFLDVINESHMHNVPANAETHFKVVVVSEKFQGKRSVQRHQQVYGCLAEELQSGVHALAIQTYLPDEWVEQQVAPQSPNCLGGGGQ